MSKTNTQRPAVAPWIAASIADLIGVAMIIAIQERWTLFAAAGLHVAALLPVAFLKTLKV